MRICSIEWCGKKHHWKWYCSTHHTRFLKHWDANITKNIRWEDRINNKLYSLYLWIRKRCLSTNCKNYKNYWWRWITLCDRWNWKEWFKNFLADMWPRPDWYSVWRIDNDWPYSPENCRRETRHQQASNRRNSNEVVWVSRHKEKSKWVSTICVSQNIVLWSYDKFEDAVYARKEAELKYKIY